MTMQS